MRIVHFLNHTLVANGHVNVAVDLACEQVRQGHQVWIIAADSDHLTTLEAAGVQYVTLPMSARGAASSLSLQTLRGLPRMGWFLRKALAKIRPDVVHSHMSFAALLAWSTRLGARYKLVTTVHNSFDRQSVLMGCADKTVCVSHAVAATMGARGISERKLAVVWNGTRGSARLQGAPGASAELRHPSIVTVAGLHPRKGIADLIEAFRLLQNEGQPAFLYIVGSGPSETDFRQLADQTGHADRITFLGHCPDPRTVLGDADVFALASHADPFPLAVLEAMEAGCAVVASNVDGIPEAVDHGRAGVLVPPRDPVALAAALHDLLRHPEKLAALRAASLERARRFSVERMAGEYVDVYASLVSA